MLSLGNKLTLTTQPIYKFVNEHSIDFDGSDQCIVTDGADTVVQNTTYSFWCKSSTTAQNKGVFGHGSDRKGAFHFNENADRPMLWFNDSYYVYWADNSAQDDGEWHHWVVYADSTNIANCKLYIDSVLQSSVSTSNTGGAAYTESLTIGGDKAVGGNYFEGKIDEFAVYDRELTQAEITRMYNTYYSPNRVANGNFSQIGNEEVTNGDFSQIGSELITNGDFASDTGWTKQTGWSIANGSASYDGSGTGYQYILQSITTTSGSIYKINFDVLSSTGSNLNIVDFGSVRVNQTHLSEGNYTYYAQADASSENLVIYANGTDTFSIDNVSVKEVGQDWSFADGWNMADGVVNATAGSATKLQQSISGLSGKSAKVTFTLSNYGGNGSVIVDFGSTNSASISANGTHTVYGAYDQNYFQLFKTSDFSGTIDNISVKEVGQHWTFGTGWGMGDGITNANVTSTAGLTQSLTGLTIGASYKLTLTISNYVTGSLQPQFGGVLASPTSASSNGTHTFDIIPTGTTHTLYLYALNTSQFSVDNIVVQELKHDATNLMLNAGAYQSANPLITSTKSMEFDGVDTTLEANEELSGTYTFAAWVKRDTIPSAWQYIVDFRRGNTSSQYVAYNASGGFGLGTGSNVVYVDGVTSSTAPNDTKWHHIVVTGLSVANSSKINIGSRYTGLEAIDGNLKKMLN